ncbi:ABC transporter ATP-binding protein [Desulfogranum marinum]|uniref:ABC transporter ATP-binding protein n=1 Tax=Desulfogranum marinum TaxID=453220 RepID=UPI0029C6F5E2|nr:ABC transporter ATP-binding protein [Desulfogranum marinum]
MNIISCIHLSKTYRHGFLQKKNKPALKDLNLTVQRGEVFGIIGPNGAGKSTTIKAIMGFIRPDSGTVSIDEVAANDPHSHAHIGYLPETPCLYKHLSITDHLYFAAKLAQINRKQAAQKIEEVLTIVNLDHVPKIPIRQYSKGMTQRAALAYALLLEPNILILDEPMSGLDPLGRHLVVNIIRDYHAKGNTILFCSHVLSDVERICTRIGIMHQGELATITTPQFLQDNITPHTPDTTPLESFFLKTVQGITNE